MRSTWLALGVALAACTFDAPDVPNLERARALADEVDADALLPSVEAIVATHLADEPLPCDGYEVSKDYPACNLTRDGAVQLVRKRLRELGYTTQTLSQLGAGPEIAHNVVAELRGTELADEVVLIGAHVDAFHAGADDNASGVAVLLEVARIVARHRFTRTVRFVAFDLEERGAAGSTRYVEAGHADDVVAALILECVGFSDARAGSQDAPPGFQLGDVGDSLAVAANGDSRSIAQQILAINDALDFVPMRAAVAGGSAAFPLTGALLRSDNGSFWLRGLRAVMLTDTANYRNPHYHRETDTPDTLDPTLLAAAARITVASVAVLAGAKP